MKSCSWDSCSEPKSGNSKYCQEHKAEARSIWLANVRASSEEREARYAHFAQVVEQAHRAGMKAGREAVPVPMLVSECDTTFEDGQLVDRPMPGGKNWLVNEGVCGFAWVNVKPGNSSFARWLVKQEIAQRDCYYGGVTIWVHHFGQSFTRKEAYTQAYARVLQEELADQPIRVWVGSRLD